MAGDGTRTFLEPDHYEASLGQAQIQAIILPRDKFRARLTWAELHHSQVLRCEEDAAPGPRSEQEHPMETTPSGACDRRCRVRPHYTPSD